MTREPIPINAAEDVRHPARTPEHPSDRDGVCRHDPNTASHASPQESAGRSDQISAESSTDPDAQEAPATPQRPISAAKLAANRENARRSTGPRTPAGKRRSRWNATQHGLFSKYAVIDTDVLKESREEFDGLHAALRRDLKPKGTAEELLVERIATIYWRHARLLRFESTQIHRAMQSPASELQQMIYGRPKELTMEMPPESVDQMILRREALNDRQLYRALHELERRQRARRGEDVEPPKAHV